MATMTKDDKIRACTVTQHDGGYTVKSPSGNTYEVAVQTRLDGMGSMYFRRSCSCPARRRCVHVDAVEQYQWAEAADADDFDGMTVLDRTD